jgi:hypothetical protein
MTFSPTWYPVVDDSVPGAGDGTRIRAAHINDIVAKVNTLGTGGGGSTNVYTVDYSGAFGPGLDELYAISAGPFEDPTLVWGPDWLLFQTPWGDYRTVHPVDGDSVACAAYFASGGVQDPTKETIWTLVEGVWVEDTTRPVPPGTIVVVDAFLPEEWLTGIMFVKGVNNRLELPGIQYLRAANARSSISYKTPFTGVDDGIGGAPVGTVLLETGGSPGVNDITRTLPADATPGHEIVYINIGNGNVTIVPPTGTTIVGATTINGNMNWVGYVLEGTKWYARRGIPDASDIPYTPATPGDWTTVPTTVAEALDTLGGSIP